MIYQLRKRGIGSYDDNGIWTADGGTWDGPSTPVGTTYENCSGGFCTNTGGGGGGFDWASIFAPITNAAGKIVTAQYGQPNIPAGTVLINGPNGQQMIRYANGQEVPYVPSSVNVRVPTGNSNGLLIAAAIAIGAVFVLKAVK